MHYVPIMFLVHFFSTYDNFFGFGQSWDLKSSSDCLNCTKLFIILYLIIFIYSNLFDFLKYYILSWVHYLLLGLLNLLIRLLTFSIIMPAFNLKICIITPKI